MSPGHNNTGSLGQLKDDLSVLTEPIIMTRRTHPLSLEAISNKFKWKKSISGFGAIPMPLEPSDMATARQDI